MRDGPARLLFALAGFSIGLLPQLMAATSSGCNKSAVACASSDSGANADSRRSNEIAAAAASASTAVAAVSTYRSCSLRNAIGAGVSCSEVHSDHGFSWAAPLPTFRQKGDLPRILEAEGHSIGVEVGVLDGRFAEWMLRTWKSSTAYYLVDPWVPHDETYRDASKQSAQDAANFMRAAEQRVAPFGGRATLLRNFSADAARRFSAASVDFVFIDARHSYDAVLEDLHAWWPKLRPGGILAGHDYVDADE